MRISFHCRQIHSTRFLMQWYSLEMCSYTRRFFRKRIYQAKSSIILRTSMYFSGKSSTHQVLPISFIFVVNISVLESRIRNLALQ